jgi:hypothetical protein
MTSKAVEMEIVDCDVQRESEDNPYTLAEVTIDPEAVRRHWAEATDGD